MNEIPCWELEKAIAGETINNTPSSTRRYNRTREVQMHQYDEENFLHQPWQGMQQNPAQKMSQ
jgi:hypothetical protein